jgi:hypothetical protein
LPAAMKADKATIPKGENQVEIEIKASAAATDGARPDVFARSIVGAKQVDSLRFTVNVLSIGQQPGLELKVEPALIKVGQGGSVMVKVTAARKGYTGPIEVELRNLPAELESTKRTIAEGENSVEIALVARSKAEPGTKADVCAVGTATFAANCLYASPYVTVQVGRK